MRGEAWWQGRQEPRIVRRFRLVLPRWLSNEATQGDVAALDAVQQLENSPSARAGSRWDRIEPADLPLWPLMRAIDCAAARITARPDSTDHASEHVRPERDALAVQRRRRERLEDGLDCLPAVGWAIEQGRV